MTKAQAHSSLLKQFIRYYLDHGSVEAGLLLGELSRLMVDVDQTVKGHDPHDPLLTAEPDNPAPFPFETITLSTKDES